METIVNNSKLRRKNNLKSIRRSADNENGARLRWEYTSAILGTIKKFTKFSFFLLFICFLLLINRSRLDGRLNGSTKSYLITGVRMRRYSEDAGNGWSCQSCVQDILLLELLCGSKRPECERRIWKLWTLRLGSLGNPNFILVTSETVSDNIKNCTISPGRNLGGASWTKSFNL